MAAAEEATTEIESNFRLFECDMTGASDRGVRANDVGGMNCSKLSGHIILQTSKFWTAQKYVQITDFENEPINTATDKLKNDANRVKITTSYNLYSTAPHYWRKMHAWWE